MFPSALEAINDAISQIESTEESTQPTPGQILESNPPMHIELLSE